MNDEAHEFLAQIERELVELQGRAPAWSTAGVRAGVRQPLEREERDARRERRIAGERLQQRKTRADALEQGSGETWLRERLSATPWGVPKEVWRARRDREREILDAEDALRDERLDARDRYSAELRALGEGDTAGEEEAGITAEALDKLWRRWRTASELRAEALLQRDDVRRVLCSALRTTHEPAALARAAAPKLLKLPELPPVAVLHAALALAAVQRGLVGLGCTADEL